MDDFLIECSPGISGDMLLGAFYDLGVPKTLRNQKVVQSEVSRQRLRILIVVLAKELGGILRNLF